MLLKLGGSLITDKRRPCSVRRGRLTSLARQIAAAADRWPGRLIVGHGSGSFGHVAAKRSGIGDGPLAAEHAAGISATQQSAADLHRQVVTALARAGARPFSLAPSSFLVTDRGRPAGVGLEPLERALALGLLPVVYGDVVADRAWGFAIASTERVFEALVEAWIAHGGRIELVLWLGETAGVLGADGTTIRRIAVNDLSKALAAVGPTRGHDVTGGMAHRLESAVRLARLDVPSLVADGRVEGIVRSGLSGRGAPGTRVVA